MDQQQHIENEVQRRIARITHQYHQEVDDLKARIREMQGGLTKQLAIIQRLTAEPLYFGTLLRKHNIPDSALFKVNDAVVVIDSESEHFGQAGRIVSSDPVVDENGMVTVELEDTNQTVTTFAIGTNGAAQIRLAQKADGTFAVISVDGKPWEVQGIPDLTLDVGESVKIKADTKQIISRGYDMTAGPICRVLAVTEKGVEVEEKGEKRLVVNAKNLAIEEGDRVVVDPGFFTVIEKLARDSRQRYKLTSDLGVTWDDIGGLDNAKHQCRQAIELPFKHKDLFAHYKMKKDCGVLLYGPPGCGKASALSSLVMTPQGPIKMGDVKMGQYISTPDGKTAKVAGIFPQGEMDIYRVFFSDESYADCTLDHLWQVEAQNEYKEGVLETRYLKDRLRMNDGKRIYSIPMSQPVFFEEKKHLIDPYVIGAILGDGYIGGRTIYLSSADKEIVDKVSALLPEGYSLRHKDRYDYSLVGEGEFSIKDELCRLSLYGHKSESKFVPDEYLIDSVENRMKLLQGLMDTDGHVSKHGYTVNFCTTSLRLAENVQFLVQSLGGECPMSVRETTYTYKGEKKQGKVSFLCRINLKNLKDVFSLKRKRDRVIERTKYMPKRMIDRIEFQRREQAQCILVDHPDHLYITDNFVVTHNTLLAKAAAGALARLHGKSAVSEGFIYVKSPEILDKWVGNTEAEIRELFERGRRHYRQHGYPAILAFDEFDAIAPQRGTRRSSDVADTIVPMFLGEMDGIDEKQTMENPILFVMTNRADILDPAITRPGRISRHIKIERPNADNALDILRIHSEQVPFFKEDMRMTILAVACQDIFSKTRLIYRVNNEHDFTLGDTVNGAMLAAIVQDAKSFAIERDIESGTQTGVTLEDYREAVKKCYREQRGMNHSYDIADFLDRLGLQPKDAQVERCFGAC